MVKKKTKIATSGVATFGVAILSVYVASDVNAEIMDITWNGGAESFENPFVNIGGISVFIDQIPNGSGQTMSGAATEAGQFFQWNDMFGTDGVGRTMEIGFASDEIGPMSMRQVQPGEVLDPANFVGQQNDIGNAGNTAAGAPASNNTFNGTGTAFIAIRPFEAPGNLYWFRCSFTAGGSITYLEGQYGSAGEVLTVGETDQCENALGDANGDGVVNLLDVGAFVTAILDTDTFDCEADINEDGVDDLLDVGPFVDLLLGG